MDDEEVVIEIDCSQVPENNLNPSIGRTPLHCQPNSYFVDNYRRWGTDLQKKFLHELAWELLHRDLRAVPTEDLWELYKQLSQL